MECMQQKYNRKNTVTTVWVVLGSAVSHWNKVDKKWGSDWVSIRAWISTLGSELRVACCLLCLNSVLAYLIACAVNVHAILE